MAQAEQKRGLFAQKNKGKRFTFEGKNTNTDQLVRGEVVAKDEEEARKKLQRRGIRPLRISKVKATKKRRITQEDITVFTRQLTTKSEEHTSELQSPSNLVCRLLLEKKK